MTSPLLARPGAVPGDPPDEAVAWHYGDLLREQRTLDDEAAVVDRSDRDVLLVTGPDRLPWLHSLTSQHLERLAPGESTEALVLSPHGHVEHHLVLTDDGTTTWVDVEPGTGEALRGYLDSMRFMLRVEVTSATPEWAVLTVGGRQRPSYDAIVAAAGPDAVVRQLPWGVDLVLPRSAVAAVVDALRLPVVGLGAFEALRVAAGRPRLGRETDHRSIPHELGWIGVAVHLEKGCYRGQETVARVHNLGRPPRRLVRLHLDGTQETLPPAGTPVELDGRARRFPGHRRAPLASRARSRLPSSSGRPPTTPT